MMEKDYREEFDAYEYARKFSPEDKIDAWCCANSAVFNYVYNVCDTGYRKIARIRKGYWRPQVIETFEDAEGTQVTTYVARPRHGAICRIEVVNKGKRDDLVDKVKGMIALLARRRDHG